MLITNRAGLEGEREKEQVDAEVCISGRIEKDCLPRIPVSFFSEKSYSGVSAGYSDVSQMMYGKEGMLWIWV